jgi:hypothetical protein
MGNKHKEYIFNAIRDGLLEQESKEEQRLSYNALYDKVNRKIKGSRGEGISPRDFSSELKLLVKEKKIQRTEDEDSKRKIKPVYLSLTQNAKREHRLGILGIDPEKERLRRLYQLLFFYTAISPIRNISEEQLGKIKNELVIESKIHTVGTNFTEIIYKPKPPAIESFRIITRELSDVRPKGKTKVSHYYKPWSFLKEEIVNLVVTDTTVRQKRKKSQNSIVMPFVSSLFPFTEGEINKAFDILRDTLLIRPVQDLILNQTRFIIADESLQRLVNDIWTIHWLELEILEVKMNYFEPPNEKEIQWLKQIYDENEAMKIIAKAYQTRRSFSSTTDQDRIKNIQKNMEYYNKLIDSLIMHVKKKYDTKIQEYGFPSDFIEQVCFRKIFSKNED